MVPEVGVVILDEEHMASLRNIILHYSGGGLQRIKKLHPPYNSLSYPLLFPNNRCRWSPTFEANTGLTLKSFVQYVLQKWLETNILHRASRLFRQYVVDQYLRVEHENLLFIRQHQAELQAKCYQGIVDAMQEDNGALIRRCIVFTMQRSLDLP